MKNKTAIEQLAITLAYEIRCSNHNVSIGEQLIKQYVDELISVLEVYQEINVDYLDFKKQEKIEGIELEKIKNRLSNFLNCTQSSLESLSKKANSLAEIYHCGEGDREEVDLHVRLDRNLATLQERFEANQEHPKIEVVREYGDIAKIECYERDIDRVLINILDNAIDAVEESNHGRTYEEIERNPNIIQIHTEINGDTNTAKIVISDNGLGIEEKYIDKIFDPFFTTKSQYSKYKYESNKHQGMGLFISRYIIEEKHGGQLSYDSTPGEGSEFTIELPIQPIEP